eukprot:CAMPEP_0175247268 /NCGR_PEP_ID=MMETSP0093-20121207/33534_1 /TAXON_ID=311494 /ORGANISM="Alexandrium monilatum, Strain CCMP3105" /LENGTH=101 /DNA_ID=CAMNT_0016541445 /DNA_START=72 /DNA_END=377 /DNA_ORIENTATION=+
MLKPHSYQERKHERLKHLHGARSILIGGRSGGGGLHAAVHLASQQGLGNLDSRPRQVGALVREEQQPAPARLHGRAHGVRWPARLVRAKSTCGGKPPPSLW